MCQIKKNSICNVRKCFICTIFADDINLSWVEIFTFWKIPIVFNYFINVFNVGFHSLINQIKKHLEIWHQTSGLFILEIKLEVKWRLQ